MGPKCIDIVVIKFRCERKTITGNARASVKFTGFYSPLVISNEIVYVNLTLYR